MWVVHWALLPGLPWRTWVHPVRARCGGGAAAWVAGILAAPGTQGGWQPGQQEILCSRRVWEPVLASMLQYSCLENPLSDREAWQATVYRGTKSWTLPKPPCMHRHETFFAVAALPQRGLSVKVAQLLGLWGPWRHQVFRDMDCLHPRSYGPLSLFSRRRPWHPTPVLLPGKSHGRRSLVGCSPWGR